MSDYISRKDALVALSALLKDIKENPIGDGASPHEDGIWQGEKSCAVEAVLRVKAIPAADVRPVVHGRWIEDDSGVVICSNCGEEHEWDQYRASFCDECGADMRGEIREMNEYVKEQRNPANDYTKGWNACLRSVQQQPTIIEAEEAAE